MGHFGLGVGPGGSSVTRCGSGRLGVTGRDRAHSVVTPEKNTVLIKKACI